MKTASLLLVGLCTAGLPLWADEEPERRDVLATAYLKPGRTLVSLASWATEPVDCRLRFDWPALGFDPNKAHLFAPAIEGFQPAALFKPDEAISIFPGRGWLLVVDQG